MKPKQTKPIISEKRFNIVLWKISQDYAEKYFENIMSDSEEIYSLK